MQIALPQSWMVSHGNFTWVSHGREHRKLHLQARPMSEDSPGLCYSSVCCPLSTSTTSMFWSGALKAVGLVRRANKSHCTQNAPVHVIFFQVRKENYFIPVL